MDPIHEILRAVGRIEGRLDEFHNKFHKVSERVDRFEIWHSWLKAGRALVAAVRAAWIAFHHRGRIGAAMR